MVYLYLVSSIAGLLLSVRLMFFGAERRKHAVRGAVTLRRSEPATVSFLIAFGVSGYLLTHTGSLSPSLGAGVAVLVAAAGATLVTRLALATARIQPEHDPEDPRYRLQGRIAVVIEAIPAGGEGAIRYEDAGIVCTQRARDIDAGAIGIGEEVCIERVADGVAHIERWEVVERRL